MNSLPQSSSTVSPPKSSRWTIVLLIVLAICGLCAFGCMSLVVIGSVYQGFSQRARATTAAGVLKTSAGWMVLLTDNFDDNKNGWTTGEGKSIANGRYVWDMDNRVNIYRGLPEMPAQSDFAASIDGRLVSGSDDCGMGLTFRNIPETGGMTDYVFYIHNDQRWGFDIIHYPDPGIAQSGRFDAIVPRALNRITVIAQGRHFTFFVNGKYVGEAEDGTLAQGKIGAAVWILGPGGCQIEFDNFEVRVPK